MKLGRNDPCHCGSGKKYKKCCLLKDEETQKQEASKIAAEQIALAASEQSRKAAEIQNSNRPPVPIELDPLDRDLSDPHMDAINARWKEFDSEGECNVRREIFVKTLGEPELMDAEMAFEMLNNLYLSADASDDLERVDELMNQLAEQLPEVYAHDRKYYLGWRISIALSRGKLERLFALSREMAELAGDHVDQFSPVVDLLAYHGHFEALSETMRIAWPLIKDSENIMWGQSTFARWGADCVLFQHLERSRELDSHDPELIEQMRFYFDNFDLDWFVKYVQHLSGRAERTWSLGDFQKIKRNRKEPRSKDAPAEDHASTQASKKDRSMNLGHLVTDFVDYARHQEGVSYTKAALARDNILNYIRRREEGELEPRQSMMEAMFNPRPQPKPRVPEHYLCPDRETLDRYLGEMMDILGPQFYAAAATFELMPTWFRFLETRGLIDSQRREKTLGELGNLQSDMVKVLKTNKSSDTELLENLQRWHESAKQPLRSACPPNAAVLGDAPQH